MRLRTPIVLGACALALVPATNAHAVTDEVEPFADGAQDHAERIIDEKREIRRERRIAARKRLRARRQAVAVPGHLQAIAACESGGNPGAVDPSGTYRGKYQFDLGTWRSVGGTGDPAAAPEPEQDRRAAILYARAGSEPWPNCG